MKPVLRLVEAPPPRQRLIFGSALVHQLIDCAARHTGVSPELVTGPWRFRDLVWTRWAVYIVARERGRALTLIADCFNRDHTTIIHGLRAARSLQDSEFLKLVSILRAEASA